MGLIKKAADLAYTFRFLTLLTTPFEKTKAYDLGLIDENGKKLKRPETSEEKDAYTPFIRLVFNIKKLIPGGRIGSYASALYLIKDHYSIPERQIEKVLREAGIDPLDFMAENTEWFMLDNYQLSPGVYVLKNTKLLNSTLEEMAFAKDKVKIDDDAFPIGDVFGLNIYEAIHIKTKQKIYVTASELLK